MDYVPNLICLRQREKERGAKAEVGRRKTERKSQKPVWV